MAKKKSIRMPVLALRGLMVFPYMVLHFDVGRPRSVAALEAAMTTDQRIFLTAQQDTEVEDPEAEDLCRMGTVAVIRQVMNLPGDSLRVLVEGERRAVLERMTQEDPCFMGDVRPVEDACTADDIEVAALVRAVKDFFEEYGQASQRVSHETVASIREVEDAAQISDIIAANVLTRLEDRQKVLEETDVAARLDVLCTILAREIELVGVEKQVQARVKKQIERNQKDYYLREQVKAIQTELGDAEATDTEELRERMLKTPDRKSVV